MSVPPSVTVTFSRYRHLQNNTPVDEVIKVFSELVTYHTEAAKAYLKEHKDAMKKIKERALNPESGSVLEAKK